MKTQPTGQELAKYLKMPKNIEDLIDSCNFDLYEGPAYFDASGNQCLWCDTEASQFDFSGAVDKISDWLSKNNDNLLYNIECETIERQFDIENEDPLESRIPWEDYYQIDVKDVLFGSELRSYV